MSANPFGIRWRHKQEVGEASDYKSFVRVNCQTQQQVQWQVQTAKLILMSGKVTNTLPSSDMETEVQIEMQIWLPGDPRDRLVNVIILSLWRERRNMVRSDQSSTLHKILIFLSNFRRSACRSRRASSSKRTRRHRGRLIGAHRGELGVTVPGRALFALKEHGGPCGLPLRRSETIPRWQ